MRPIRLAIALAVLLALGIASAASAQLQPWTGSSIIQDPAWQKRFLGSYGFLSGAEPQVNAAELEVLREVIDLMKVNPKAAAAMLQQQMGPKSSAALDFILANLQFQDDQKKQAMASYQSALTKFPDFRRAHKNLALLLVQENDCKAAIPHLSAAIELGDRDGRTYGLLGYCYIGQEDNLAAEQAYRNAILAEPAVRDWKIGLARALLSMEKYAEAAALFQSLIAENPDDPSAWLLQANAYVGLDKPLSAASNLEAVRLMGKAQTSSLILLGDIYMNAGMTDLARSAYVEVVEHDRDGARFPTAYRAADLLVRTHSWDQAQQVLASIDRRYGKSLGTDDQLKVLTLKAKVARGQGHTQEAAQLLESIVKRDGTRGDALLELASYYQSQGNTPMALLLVERAEKLDAFRYQALLEHAQIQVSAREYAQAADLLRKALQIKQEARVEQFLTRVQDAARS